MKNKTIISKNKIKKIHESGKYKTDVLWAKNKYFIYQKNTAQRLRKAGKGASVEPTMYAYGNGIFRTYKTGKIVGWGREENTVRVVLDGQKTPHTYWCGFWKL